MCDSKKNVIVLRLSPILLLSCLTVTLAYAAYIYVNYYPYSTLTAYDSWDYNYGCEWLDFKVTMDDITTNRRLYVDIQERYYVDDSFVDELFYGYLEDGETSGVVQPGDSQNHIWVYVTETDGYQTYFQLHVEGYQYQR